MRAFLFSSLLILFSGNFLFATSPAQKALEQLRGHGSTRIEGLAVKKVYDELDELSYREALWVEAQLGKQLGQILKNPAQDSTAEAQIREIYRSALAVSLKGSGIEQAQMKSRILSRSYLSFHEAYLVAAAILGVQVATHIYHGDVYITLGGIALTTVIALPLIIPWEKFKNLQAASRQFRLLRKFNSAAKKLAGTHQHESLKALKALGCRSILRNLPPPSTH